ncbi:hypothetical protein VP01_2578g2 [Puccinia sorghi]|uniref:Uncharacterized protein n=1 Tax=Puccinia sorghi TaxID=27349 RepID=A0A0L6V4W5_9BASI|nr:hypothetical protein VP01_2578g2 [Puccinia sorghi]
MMPCFYFILVSKYGVGVILIFARFLHADTVRISLCPRCGSQGVHSSSHLVNCTQIPCSSDLTWNHICPSQFSSLIKTHRDNSSEISPAAKCVVVRVVFCCCFFLLSLNPSVSSPLGPLGISFSYKLYFTSRKSTTCFFAAYIQISCNQHARCFNPKFSRIYMMALGIEVQGIPRVIKYDQICHYLIYGFPEIQNVCNINHSIIKKLISSLIVIIVDMVYLVTFRYLAFESNKLNAKMIRDCTMAFHQGCFPGNCMQYITSQVEVRMKLVVTLFDFKFNNQPDLVTNSRLYHPSNMNNKMRFFMIKNLFFNVDKNLASEPPSVSQFKLIINVNTIIHKAPFSIQKYQLILTTPITEAESSFLRKLKNKMVGGYLKHPPTTTHTRAWKANQISSAFQASFFSPWNMSQSCCNSPPSLSSNLPRLLCLVFGFAQCAHIALIGTKGPLFTYGGNVENCLCFWPGNILWLYFMVKKETYSPQHNGKCGIKKAFFILVEGLICFQNDIKLSFNQVTKELYSPKIRLNFSEKELAFECHVKIPGILPNLADIFLEECSSLFKPHQIRYVIFGFPMNSVIDFNLYHLFCLVTNENQSMERKNDSVSPTFAYLNLSTTSFTAFCQFGEKQSLEEHSTITRQLNH